MTGDRIRPVILCGGSGTRLWPASRRAWPKQFHKLTGPETLIQETARRAHGEAGGVSFSPALVVAGRAHAEVVLAQLRSIGLPPEAVIVEPEARNTAAAVAAAAAYFVERGEDAPMAVLPADHYVADPRAFRQGLVDALALALDGRMVLFGVTPTAPETGYGYVERGEATGPAFAVARFAEKPSLAEALEYLASGRYFWNAGLVMARPSVILAQTRACAPEVAAAVEAAFANARVGNQRVELSAAEFRAAPQISFDYAVLEKTKGAVVAPLSVGWSDVGSWAAIWETASRDERGNAALGEAVLVDCAQTLTVSEGPIVAGIGLRDMVVVATAEAVLVAPRDEVQRVKEIVDALKARGREDLL